MLTGFFVLRIFSNHSFIHKKKVLNRDLFSESNLGLADADIYLKINKLPIYVV